MDVLIGGVGIVLLVAAIFGISNPKVYEDLRIPLDTWSKRLLAIAVGAVFASIGLGWIRPPTSGVSGGPATAEVAATATTEATGTAEVAAATATASATSPATATAGASRPVRTVTRREAHWTNASTGGDVLDGGVYTPHKRVWLEELFPSGAPTQFTVTENVDPSLPAQVRSALRLLAPPPFGVAVAGQEAVSAQAWQLPDPIAGLPSRSFSFRGVNPDGTTTAAGTIVSGLVSIHVAGGASGCLRPSSDGKTFVAASGDSCLQLSIQGATDPVLNASVLVPWGAGDADLIGTVQASFGSLATAIAQQHPNVQFDPGKAMAAFETQNAQFLPAGPPDGWEISMPQPTLNVGPARPVVVRIAIHAPSAGRAMLALKLSDPANPSDVAISQLIPLVVEPPNGTQTPSASAGASVLPSEPPSPSPAASPS